MLDELKEECGIVGIYNHPEASNLAYLGLYAMQHRGQEGAGIVSADGERLYPFRRWIFRKCTRWPIEQAR